MNLEELVPQTCGYCDFEREPYQKLIVILRLQVGGDGKLYVDGVDCLHAHCWSNHVPLLERRPP